MQINIIGKEKVLVHVFYLERYNSSVALAPTGEMLERPWAVFLKEWSEKPSRVWEGRCLSVTSDLLHQNKGLFAFKSVLGDSLLTKVWEPLL